MLEILTPGRICLFGEHQDYLGLPVIAAGISLRISIKGSRNESKQFVIKMSDINQTETVNIDSEINYKNERDYLRSSIRVLKGAGFTFSKGLECEIRSKIPINAGTSSSSALVVSWINFLTRISDQGTILSSHEIAELAYEAEVLQFGEPGGMMDQYSTAIGGVIHIESSPQLKTKSFNTNLGTFVLGNSREPKDTKTILARVKGRVLRSVDRLIKIDKDFSLNQSNLDDLKKLRKYVDDTEYELLRGTIINRDITLEADEILSKQSFDEDRIGNLLYKHHTILKDYQKISTLKIDEMIEAAMAAGALGAKINGSGGGGCMFAYAPNNAYEVYEAVKKISGEAYIVTISDGSKCTSER